MDILLEILVEIYMELMMLIVPEEKRGKKHYRIATAVAIVCTFGLFALALWGIALIVEKDNALGVLPLSIAVILSIAQIVFGIILFIKRNKKEVENQTEVR